MADDFTVTAGTVAADELDTLNGVSQSSPKPKAQRFKPTFGVDGAGTDVSAVSPLPVVDSAGGATLAAVLAKLIAAPATEASLAAVLAKLTADPSTATAQATQATKLDTLHTDVAAVLAKLIAAPATEATLATVSTALAHGTYAYASGTSAGTVDVPSGARVKRVSVLAGVSAGATITIAGGTTITVVAGTSFDEQIPGDATLGGDVVIGGTIQSYYVAWTT